MIFVTVGTQLPFDRLIGAVDCVAKKLSLHVVAQTGKGTYRAEHITVKDYIDAAEFRQLCSSADLIVSHAGIGTILSAQAARKPIVLMPRKAAFGEHRNDHQLATAAKFSGKQGIYIAHTELELERLLSGVLDPPVIEERGSTGLLQLTSYLRNYIQAHAVENQCSP